MCGWSSTMKILAMFLLLEVVLRAIRQIPGAELPCIDQDVNLTLRKDPV
jgi:hypothetical protein